MDYNLGMFKEIVFIILMEVILSMFKEKFGGLNVVLGWFLLEKYLFLCDG